MKLKQVQLTNFRTHKKLSVVLDPFITTICGSSFKGKSTIVRALRWVILNQPHGTRMLRWGSRFAKVVLHLDNGTAVMRLRGKGKNVYKIKTAQGIDELDGLQRGKVPEPVAKLLNIGEENFQKQHASPFMLNAGSPHVARHLNRIVALQLIDKLQAKLNQYKRAADAKVGEYKASVEELTTQCKQLAFVPAMVKAYRRIQHQQQVLDDMRQEREALEFAIDELVGLRKFLHKPANIDKLDEQYDAIANLQNERVALQRAITQLDGGMKRVEVCRQTYRATKARYDKLAKGRCPLCGRVR